MKILVLSDHESKSLYDYYTPEKLKDIDLIISCGDLKASYLTFFATFSKAPVFYVMGNHDVRYLDNPPEGCTCIEDDIVTFRGVRILGLGGSMEYIPDSRNQYTEKKMARRIRRLWWKLWRYKGFDILVTHAPAREINDLPDLPHQGFSCFRDLMDKYSPKYFLHGHIHSNYGNAFKREDKYVNTVVVNGYEYCIIDFPEIP